MIKSNFLFDPRADKADFYTHCAAEDPCKREKNHACCMRVPVCIHAHMLMINMCLPCPQTPRAEKGTLQNTQQGQTQLIPRQCQ